MIESPVGWSILKSNLFLGYPFQNGTVFDLLDAARIPWCIYEGDEFPQAFAIRGMTKQWIFHDAFRDFSRFAAEVSKPDDGWCCFGVLLSMLIATLARSKIIP